MNIQINCKDNVDKDDILFILYNIQEYIEEYKENKNDIFHYKYINGTKKYYKHIDGNSFMTTNINMTCNGKTMYFKIN